MSAPMTINADGFFLDGKPFYLASGDVHYFRLHPSSWRRHLTLAKDFGLTAIQTYVPWNLHEPEKGRFCFDGHLDLFAYLDLAREMGLYVLLRPAPYICSECEFGGLPAWLLQEPDLEIRCSNKAYLHHVKEYYEVLVPKLLPYLSTNGGPILMVAIENEYGGSGYDKEYLQFIADTFTRLGIDVPLYTTDNNPAMLQMGSLPGVMLGSNFRSGVGNGKLFADYTEKFFPDFPFFVGELWAGRSMHWGEPYHKRELSDTVASYAECLSRGFVNFYMFSGGTNFGFFSGAIYGKSHTPRPGSPNRFIAHTTSYDEDALVTENGLPTEKYYLCRAELDKALGRPVLTDRTLPFTYEVQTPEIRLTEYARLFDELPHLTTAERDNVTPLTMEEMGQQSGFILYSTDIAGWREAGNGVLLFDGIHDRATFYDGENYIGSYLRERPCERIGIDVTDRTATLNILIEDVARINGGKEIDADPKGLTHYVTFNYAKLYHWHMRSLPMTDLSGICYRPLDGAELKDNDPVFYRGVFDAKPGVDTFLDMRPFGRGFVRINGFSLGCFWNIGPQYTLYVPGGLLKETGNVIELFDVNPIGKKTSVGTLSEAILEGDGVENGI